MLRPLSIRSGPSFRMIPPPCGLYTFEALNEFRTASLSSGRTHGACCTGILPAVADGAAEAPGALPSCGCLLPGIAEAADRSRCAGILRLIIVGHSGVRCTWYRRVLRLVAIG